MRKTVWISSFVLLAILVALGIGWFSYPWRNINPDFMFRVLALSEPLTLTSAEKEAAVQVVQDALRHSAGADAPTDVPADIPESLAMRNPREVWVSLFLPRQKGLTGLATEDTLYRSLRMATRAALDTARNREIWQTQSDEIAIQIDILQGRSSLLTVREPYLFLTIEPGVHGIIIRRGKRLGYQLPSDVVTKGMLTPGNRGRIKNIKEMMGRACMALGLRRKAWKEDPEVKLSRFTTLSFGRPVASGPIRDFYRANVLLTPEEVTAKRIYQGIQAGGQYLLNNARPDGKFNYQYIPNKDRDPGGYNAVRHAGTMFGLLELYRFFQEPEILLAAQKAAPYLYANIKRPGKEPDMLAMPSGGKSKAWPTGAAALSLLTFVNMPPLMRPPDYQRYLDGLGTFLLYMIDERGSVFEGYLARKGSDLVVKEPLYYPGETMLAMAKLYELTGEKRWLEGAKKIATYQIRRFNMGKQAGHWVIQGLHQLYRHTGDETYGRACLAMANSFIETQCPPNVPPFPDYFGAWRRHTELPRTTRAGSRSEALTAALRTALEMGRDPILYEDALLYAAKHQLEQQFRPENAYYLPRPDKVLGGFRAGLVDNHLRIDFNQHSAVGLIGSLEAAVRREGIDPWWKPLPLLPPDVIIQPDEVEPTPAINPVVHPVSL